MELGHRQIYELQPQFDHHVIILKIIPEPNLHQIEKERAFVNSNELVRSVQKFIDDLMRQHMTATFMKAPVVCYIPCSQCMKMHLKVDKAIESSTIYCPVNCVHADITDYHKILTGIITLHNIFHIVFFIFYKAKPLEQDPANIHSLPLNKLEISLSDHWSLSSKGQYVLYMYAYSNNNMCYVVYTQIQISSFQRKLHHFSINPQNLFLIYPVYQVVM